MNTKKLEKNKFTFGMTKQRARLDEFLFIYCAKKKKGCQKHFRFRRKLTPFVASIFENERTVSE